MALQRRHATGIVRSIEQFGRLGILAVPNGRQNSASQRDRPIHRTIRAAGDRGGPERAAEHRQPSGSFDRSNSDARLIRFGGVIGASAPLSRRTQESRGPGATRRNAAGALPGRATRHRGMQEPVKAVLDRACHEFAQQPVVAGISPAECVRIRDLIALDRPAPAARQPMASMNCWSQLTASSTSWMTSG